MKIKNDITNGPKAKSQALPKMAGPKPTVLVGPGKTSRMTPLKRQEMSADSGIGELEELVDSPTVKPDKWAMAAEFVPGQPWRGAGNHMANRHYIYETLALEVCVLLAPNQACFKDLVRLKDHHIC